MPTSKRKTIIKSLVIVILIFDQLSKYIVSQRLPLGRSIPIIKNVFHLTYILNRGAAFGILKNQTYFFIIAAIAAIIFILINLRRTRALKVKIALSLILSGAASNLLDRIRLGAVVDFLDFRIWPVFNFADSAISIGAILLAYSLLAGKNTARSRA
ncbi:MAG: signal peptidase II [Candidatus Omnitrophota bacterium]